MFQITEGSFSSNHDEDNEDDDDQEVPELVIHQTHDQTMEQAGMYE
jgi:hypothetical protein